MIMMMTVVILMSAVRAGTAFLHLTMFPLMPVAMCLIMMMAMLSSMTVRDDISVLIL